MLFSFIKYLGPAITMSKARRLNINCVFDKFIFLISELKEICNLKKFGSLLTSESLMVLRSSDLFVAFSLNLFISSLFVLKTIGLKLGFLFNTISKY